MKQYDARNKSYDQKIGISAFGEKTTGSSFDSRQISEQSMVDHGVEPSRGGVGHDRFDIRDFGMEPPRVLVLKVDPEVDVRVEIVAVKEA